MYILKVALHKSPGESLEPLALQGGLTGFLSAEC